MCYKMFKYIKCEYTTRAGVQERVMTVVLTYLAQRNNTYSIPMCWYGKRRNQNNLLPYSLMKQKKKWLNI